MNKLELKRFPSLDYTSTESVNTLCTNLSFLGRDNRKIMVTSCQSHEGKSFVSLCMLRTLAQLGNKVVHIDMDLRRSQIAGRYGMRIIEGTERGVTHFLAGMCNISDILYESDVRGAYMIPVGRTVSNSLSLLNTNRLSVLLDQLSEQFDFVIIDAPPVGMIIDAAEISKHCDGTLFVVKYNSVSRKELLEAKQQIERAGCSVLGAVLNEVDLDSISSKKYYNKGYYSHYENEISKTKKKG